MTLSRLLDGVPVTKMFQTVYGQMVVTHDVEVSAVHYDSRKVNRGDLFVAIKGLNTDGHNHISEAVTKGAKVVVVENDAILPDSFFMHAGVVKVVVQDSRKALALIAANYFDHPSRKMRVIGVTGTNGKTSTTYLIKSMLEASGEKVGLIGTIEYRIGNEIIPATHTTPEAVELNSLLATMVRHRCTAVTMEVSSHALALRRVHGLRFTAGVFTNLTQDHLDFHQTMEAYYQAKKILFDGLHPGATAVTNVDDARGRPIVTDTKANVFTYGIANAADVSASDVNVSLSGTRLTVTYRHEPHTVHIPLIGRFNVQNALAAYSTGLALGMNPETISSGIAQVEAVPGRFQRIASPLGWIAIVDYAHTPDALENSLRAIHDVIDSARRGRVITVFGCGGDRDKGKRPLMARVATELSDITVITSDNPRTEDPEAIMRDIQAGCVRGRTVYSEVDRRKAIAFALDSAREGDIVLIAGKGHETYQIIGVQRNHFDDREEVEAFIRNTQ